jgi:hypothetical protein
MKARITFLVTATLLSAAISCSRQEPVATTEADPMMGTWKLNLEKSVYDPGPPPASTTIKLEPWGDGGMKNTTDTVDAQGVQTHSEYSANFDGKDYPITGSQNYDTVSLRRIDSHTRVRIDKKGGSEVRMVRTTMAPDDRSFTSASVGVNAQGQAFHNVAVYDKQ